MGDAEREAARNRGGHEQDAITEAHSEDSLRRKLASSETKFEAAFRLSPDAVNINRLSDDSYLEINEGFTRLTGFTERDVAGRTSSDIDIWADPADRQRLVAGLASVGVVNNLEVELRRKDGGLTTALMSARIIDLDGVPCIMSVARDVSDRVAAAQAVQASEEKFRHLFDESPIAKAIALPSGEFEVNQAFLDLLGYSREELEGARGWPQLTHPEDAGLSESVKQSLLSGELNEARFEKRYLRKDGSVILAELSTSLHRAADGKPSYFMTFIVDVTERKRAETERELHTLRTEALLQMSQMVDASAEELIDFALAVAARLTQSPLGYVAFLNKDETPSLIRQWPVKMQDVSATDSPEDFPGVVAEAWSEAIRERRPVIVNSRLAHTEPLEGDAPRPSRCLLTPSLDGSEVVLVTGVLNKEADYTEDDVRQVAIITDTLWRLLERKERNQALQDRERWLNQSQRVAGLGHYIFDIVRDEWTGSEYLYEVLGVSAEYRRDFNGWLEVVHPDDRTKLANYFADDVLGQRMPFDIEYRIVRPSDQEERWVHGLGEVEWAEDDSPRAMFGIIQDITDHKRLETALRSRIVALTEPPSTGGELEFTDLFDLEDIQAIQDAFASATGVASVITKTDGTPITQPSNFCRLCNEMIRHSPAGLANCMKSDAVLGRQNAEGPVIQRCLSGGLWDAGASITAGGVHVANWLIGQVRCEDIDEDAAREYASQLGLDPEEYLVALAEVPLIPYEQFERVANALFRVAHELSVVAYQNVQQARFISDRESAVQSLAKEQQRSLEHLQQSLDSIVQIVSQVAESRDPYTAGHQRRVSQLATSIASKMGMSQEQVEEIRVASLLHDVGKISVPAEILSKPGTLSDVEFQLIQNHAKTGFEIIQSARLNGPIAEIVYQHHERCDGSGYPRGLTADALLPAAKVIMVADVVEAMMSHRPYRPSLGMDAALTEVQRGGGTVFDQCVVDACIECLTTGRFQFAE